MSDLSVSPLASVCFEDLQITGVYASLTPAGEVILTPGVAFKFVTAEVSQHHHSCFWRRMTYTVLVRHKIKQTVEYNSIYFKCLQIQCLIIHKSFMLSIPV
jgi:hypothetical protein